VPDIYFGM